MKRMLTLNIVVITIFAVILFSLGYSLHHIKTTFTHDILERYTQETRSDLIQLRLNLQTVLSDTIDGYPEILSDILVRFLNINPSIQRLQLYFDNQLISDTDITRIPLTPAVKNHCPPLTKMTPKTLVMGIYCYFIPLRVYRKGMKTDAKLYIFFDKEVLEKEIAHTLWKMMLPVITVMIFILFLSVSLIWATILRNFSRLIAWSDDPSAKPPKFHIYEFFKIAGKMHHFAWKLIKQYKELQGSLERENTLKSIMRTVTKVNELLITEREEKPFLEKSVQTLSKYRDYSNISIFLRTEGNITVAASMDGLIETGRHQKGFICVGYEELTKLDTEEKNYLIMQAEQCDQCEQEHIEIPIYAKLSTWIAIFPLRHATSALPTGYLLISTIAHHGFDEEELQMLLELASDIGFAIHAYRQQKAYEESLYTHTLTSLPNIAAFNQHINEYYGRILAIANIDRFKHINHLYGIEVADEILKSFASTLKTLLEDHDIAPFHYMSDEFILLFPKEYSKERAEHTLTRLVEQVEAHIFESKGVEIFLSIRLGVTVLQNKLAIRECLLALQEAKRRKSPIQWYTPDLKLLIKSDTIQTYRMIKEALREGRVLTYYQGIYSFENKRFSHYEALIRIEDKEGNIIPPSHFIEFAKNTRLYPQLSLKVFHDALDGIERLDSSVSVNLSVNDILNETFIQQIIHTLQQKKPSHPIIFEILESENIENYDRTIDFIQQVQSLGSKVSIDDFGSGYANFQHIARLDADILKIDGSLIKNITHNTQMLSIVKNIASIANELGMITVAEFVSDKKIYQKVQEIGIDMAQGFFLHQPSPIDKILLDQSIR